jgi:OmpA-OmpF porin, OOP family
MTRKWLISMFGAAAMTVSATALAQVPGFYAGLDVGRSEVGSENDTGFKIFGGYQFHKNIAAELGYGLLFDKSGVEVKALEATAVGVFPLANQFSLYGKLGLANVDATPGSDKTELTWGIGAQYDFTRNLGARLQWQRYETDDAIDFLSVGVVWKF